MWRVNGQSGASFHIVLLRLGNSGVPVQSGVHDKI